MKLSSLFWGLFGIVALGACSEKDMSDANGPEGKDRGRFFAVEIANPSAMTRAAELEGDYEAGSENQINSLRLYFFDNAGNAVTVNASGSINYVDCEQTDITDSGDEMNNVEKKLQATVAIKTKNGITSNVNAMVAVANHETARLGNSSLSLTALCQKIGDYSAVKKEDGTTPHFLMTSSSYAGADRQVTVATIKPENLCKSEEEAQANPVNIYIERVVAKTRLKTAWKDAAVTKEATYNGETYTAVELKDSENKHIQVNGNQVYAIFTGWDVTGTADKSYLFKRVNTATAWNLGWIWNNPDFYRSFWAMNPANVKLRYIKYNDIKREVGANGVAYCLENAADNFGDGTKSNYNPATQTGNRTQAIIAAVLVTVNEANVAAPVDLAKWAGADYTEEGVKAAMLNTVSTQIYVKEAHDTFVSIKPEHVKLVTATEAGEASDDTEDSPRFLSYLQLAEGAKHIQFYSSASEDAALTGDQANNILKGIQGARVWKSGMTYYYTDLRHLGSEETKGLYGVVRNHIYDVNINSVVGLGTPVYNPDEVIVPQKPGDDRDTYIATKINILSWRVVNNDTDLAW